MNEQNTVTISVDEYFDLRQKAEMNLTIVREIAAFESRQNDFDRKLFELSNEISRLRREVGK